MLTYILENARSARALDQKQASAGACIRRFLVDGRHSVTFFKKTKLGCLISVARYGLTGGASVFPVDASVARHFERRLDKLARS